MVSGLSKKTVRRVRSVEFLVSLATNWLALGSSLRVIAAWLHASAYAGWHSHFTSFFSTLEMKLRAAKDRGITMNTEVVILSRHSHLKLTPANRSTIRRFSERNHVRLRPHSLPHAPFDRIDGYKDLRHSSSKSLVCAVIAHTQQLSSSPTSQQFPNILTKYFPHSHHFTMFQQPRNAHHFPVAHIHNHQERARMQQEACHLQHCHSLNSRH